MDRPSNHCDLSIACFCISILVGVNAFANNHLAYNHLAYNHLAYNDLKAIDMVDNNVGWAVGENSVILHTADGGKSWRRKFRNISHQDTTLFDVGFFTPKKGVAVGGRGLILRTTNGGKTWQRVTRLVSEERLAAQHELKKFKKQKQHFNSLVVKRCGGEGDPPNRAHSIVRFWKKYSQSENTVNSTDDGLLVYSREECVAALEWYLNKKIAGLEAIIRSAPKFSPPHWIGNYRFSKIHIVNKEVALLWYGTGFLKTSDGGATWRNVVASKFKGGQAIFFLTENKGWMVGHFGRVWRTNDGGDSWDQVGFPSKWNLSAVFVQTTGTNAVVWIGGDSGQLWRSADNGRSWQRYHTEIGSAIQKILWSNEQDGLVATYNGIYVTHDQGETWANVTPPQSVQAILRPLESINMHAFDVSQEGDVWLVGTRGSVLHGELGGDSWQIYRSEWEDAQKYANQKISLGWSRFALGVGLGYVHPTGRIADRYGPGAMINFDFWFRLGRTKIGVGGIAMLLSQKENIVALPGHLHATEARPLEMLGTMVHLPVIFQVPVFEYGHFGVHAQVGAGFVYHQFWLSDDDVEKLPDNVNYTRERVGVGMLQAIVFGWYVAMPDFTVTPTATGRLGLRLRIGLQESRTWPDGGPQIDLGRKDDANLGFELWPFSTLEFIIGFL